MSKVTTPKVSSSTKKNSNTSITTVKQSVKPVIKSSISISDEPLHEGVHSMSKQVPSSSTVQKSKSKGGGVGSVNNKSPKVSGKTAVSSSDKVSGKEKHVYTTTSTGKPITRKPGYQAELPDGRFLVFDGKNQGYVRNDPKPGVQRRAMGNDFQLGCKKK